MTSYWCHKCRRRCTALERYDEGVRCGLCHEGFIEELDEDDGDHRAPAPSSRGDADQRSATGSPPALVLDGDNNPFGAFPASPFARLFQQLHNRFIAPNLPAFTPPSDSSDARAAHHRRSASEGPSTQAAAATAAATRPPQHQAASRHSGGATTPPPVLPTGGRPPYLFQQHHNYDFQPGHHDDDDYDDDVDRQQQHQPQAENLPTNDLLTHFMDQFLGPILNHAQMNNTGGRAQVIIQLGGGGGSGDQPGGGIFNDEREFVDRNGAQTCIHGNLQDYAWGEHGLDNVLTALLNTFDGAQQQMRALRPEDIAKLPMSKVTQKQMDNGTQCTTCMESFALDEPVAKLDCEHIFHPDCLKPWLARNNTCPICRTVIDPTKWGPTISDVDELD